MCGKKHRAMAVFCVSSSGELTDLKGACAVFLRTQQTRLNEREHRYSQFLSQIVSRRQAVERTYLPAVTGG